MKIKTEKDMIVEVTGKSTETVEKSQEVTVKSPQAGAASELTLICGKAEIVAQAAGEIQMTGSNVTVEGQMGTTIKGAKVDVQGTGPVRSRAPRWRSADERHHRHRCRASPSGSTRAAGWRSSATTTTCSEAIAIILATAPGERPMRPEFGCGIHDYVFESVDALRVGRLEYEIRVALDRWEPRIERARRSTFDLEPPASGELLIEHRPTGCARRTTCATSSIPST